MAVSSLLRIPIWTDLRDGSQRQNQDWPHSTAPLVRPGLRHSLPNRNCERHAGAPGKLSEVRRLALPGRLGKFFLFVFASKCRAGSSRLPQGLTKRLGRLSEGEGQSCWQGGASSTGLRERSCGTYLPEVIYLCDLPGSYLPVWPSY